jgi:hypothetical protein
VGSKLPANAPKPTSQAERANWTLEKLCRERAALMQGHYQGAVPVDLFNTEM